MFGLRYGNGPGQSQPPRIHSASADIGALDELSHRGDSEFILQQGHWSGVRLTPTTDPDRWTRGAGQTSPELTDYKSTRIISSSFLDRL